MSDEREMPMLIRTEGSPKVVSGGVKFWMSIDGDRSVRPVRVDVDYLALSDMDPDLARYDGAGTLATFENNADLICKKANSKFDAGQVTSEQGYKVISLGPEDF
jgi:hypothetical protein